MRTTIPDKGDVLKRKWFGAFCYFSWSHSALKNLVDVNFRLDWSK